MGGWGWGLRNRATAKKSSRKTEAMSKSLDFFSHLNSSCRTSCLPSKTKSSPVWPLRSRYSTRHATSATTWIMASRRQHTPWPTCPPTCLYANHPPKSANPSPSVCAPPAVCPLPCAAKEQQLVADRPSCEAQEAQVSCSSLRGLMRLQPRAEGFLCILAVRTHRLA